MRSLLACVLLMIVLAGPATAQPIVRDHRGLSDPAQWTTPSDDPAGDRGVVDGLTWDNLYNTERGQYLGGSASRQGWENTQADFGRVMFENCTRPGEVIYGSDVVAMRFVRHPSRAGLRDFVSFVNTLRLPVLEPWFPVRQPWPQVLQPSANGGRARSCEFRLIPSGTGLVPAGSGNGKFALYSTRGNRYLVYTKEFFGQGVLRWQETSNGRPPGGVFARADFVPTDLLFTSPSTVYLTIRNIGNVASSASQNEMQVRINGQTLEFLITQTHPIPPGGTRQNPLRYNGRLCSPMEVELDTRELGLKFQIVVRGAFPNDSVFANDRKTISPRFVGSAAPQRWGSYVLYPPCTGGRVIAR